MNDDIFEFDIDAELAKAEKNAEKKLMKCRSRCRRKTIAKGVKFNQRGGGMADGQMVQYSDSLMANG